MFTMYEIATLSVICSEQIEIQMSVFSGTPDFGTAQVAFVLLPNLVDNITWNGPFSKSLAVCPLPTKQLVSLDTE